MKKVALTLGRWFPGKAVEQKISQFEAGVGRLSVWQRGKLGKGWGGGGEGC